MSWDAASVCSLHALSSYFLSILENVSVQNMMLSSPCFSLDGVLRLTMFILFLQITVIISKQFNLSLQKLSLFNFTPLPASASIFCFCFVVDTSISKHVFHYLSFLSWTVRWMDISMLLILLHKYWKRWMWRLYFVMLVWFNVTVRCRMCEKMV